MQRPLSFAGRGQSRNVNAGRSSRSTSTGADVLDGAALCVALGAAAGVCVAPGAAVEVVVGTFVEVVPGVAAWAMFVGLGVATWFSPKISLTIADGEHASAAVTASVLIAAMKFLFIQLLYIKNLSRNLREITNDN